MTTRALPLGPGGLALPGPGPPADEIPSVGGSRVIGDAPEGLTLTEEELQRSEREAFAALDQGDHEATLNILMEAYGEAVYRFCRQLVRDPEMAQDVHQKTFIDAFRSLGRFRRQSKWKTWLFGIARHRALDTIKMERRRRRRFVQVEELPEPAQIEEAGTDERARNRSLQEVLAYCLDKLTPRIRAAVLLRYQDEMSYRDMARVCRERPATLQARVARAMPVLKRCLRAQGVTP